MADWEVSLCPERRFERYVGPVDNALAELDDAQVVAKCQEITQRWQERGLPKFTFVHSTTTLSDLASQLGHLSGTPGLSPLEISSLRPVLLNYVVPVALALAELSMETPTLVHTGDGVVEPDVPVLAKVRRIDTPGLRVLLPLNYTRHFGLIGKPRGRKRPTPCCGAAPRQDWLHAS